MVANCAPFKSTVAAVVSALEITSPVAIAQLGDDAVPALIARTEPSPERPIEGKGDIEQRGDDIGTTSQLPRFPQRIRKFLGKVESDR